MSAYRVNFYVS
ncbi:uncharacterized protein FFE2_16087 [Fusarium fujikuroi]|nr:uncharacterized protein FFE2_16087 [Fusarium fujikuroi]SCV50310.1 uncharacterized protein FFFS_09439 [Fusarium fujikuroi]